MKKLLILCFCLISVVVTSAQERDPGKFKNGLSFAIKEYSQPEVYIDGKKYHHEILAILDHTKIISMTLVQDSILIPNDRFKDYNTQNGLVLIHTINGEKKNEPDVIGYADEKKAKIPELDEEIKIAIRKLGQPADPVIVIDGKVSTDRDHLQKIKAETIKSISVLKNESAAYYGAPNGIIVITLKK